MKTSELIERARTLLDYGVFDDFSGNEIIVQELADRLEKTEELLKQITNSTETYGTECSTCKYNYIVDKDNEQPCLNCDFLVEDGDNYVYRGDSE